MDAMHPGVAYGPFQLPPECNHDFFSVNIISDLSLCLFSDKHVQVEHFAFKSITFVSWDLSKEGPFNPLHSHWFQRTRGIIFVVDSSDAENLPLAKDVLHQLLKEDSRLHQERNFRLLSFFCE